MKVRITKIKDSRFDGKHPNGINVGYVKEGEELYPLEIDESYYVGSLITSRVTKINEDGTFETLNSIYKREEI